MLLLGFSRRCWRPEEVRCHASACYQNRRCGRLLRFSGVDLARVPRPVERGGMAEHRLRFRRTRTLRGALGVTLLGALLPGAGMVWTGRPVDCTTGRPGRGLQRKWMHWTNYDRRCSTGAGSFRGSGRFVWVRRRGCRSLPFVVVDEHGEEVEPFSVFLRDLMLTDMSPLTARFYPQDLLRWWRLLHVLGGSSGSGRARGRGARLASRLNLDHCFSSTTTTACRSIDVSEGRRPDTRTYFEPHHPAGTGMQLNGELRVFRSTDINGLVSGDGAYRRSGG